MNDDTPSLGELLDAAITAATSGLRTGLPGRIEAYDKDKHRATVQIMIPDPFLDETGGRRPAPIAPIPDVPVAHLGFGSIRIKIPVKRGDQCWLSFSSSCLTGYKTTGELTDPQDDRRHHIADLIVEPWSTVGLKDDATLIEFTESGDLLLGSSSATQRALWGDAFLSALDTLIDSIAAAVGSSGTPAGATAAAATITTAKTTFDTAAPTYRSAKVKIG